MLSFVLEFDISELSVESGVFGDICVIFDEVLSDNLDILLIIEIFRKKIRFFKAFGYSWLFFVDHAFDFVSYFSVVHF